MDGKRAREDSDDAVEDRVALMRVPPPSVPRTERSTAAVSLSSAEPSAHGVNPFTGRPFSSRYAALLRTREQLPVYAQKDVILQAVLANPVTVLVGETGSGKTTQVPHFIGELYTSFPGVVACTQPRRIAAVSVATRVAEEMDVTLGEEVGYHVRFQSVRGDRTRVLYMTDGMLLREAVSDANLSRYSVVVVDEAHERTVETDVLLGLLKQLAARRPAFRLVVMSATLDVTKILAFFPGAPLVTVRGRMHEVAVCYAAAPVTDYVRAAVDEALRIHACEAVGDVLCFLPGAAEVERAVTATREAVRGKEAPRSEGEAGTSVTGAEASPPRPQYAVVLPLFGSLNLTEQQRVFQRYPADTRKIVFATNIAETSVTVDGVVYVVDSGYQKQSLYSSQARVDYLLPAVISKASAEQRRGRAGRTRPGKCFRLFTEADFVHFPAQAHAEILRTNMVNTVLLLLNLGVENVIAFPFLDPPSDEALADAFYQLTFFEAVDDALQLTAFGRRMAALPIDACLARMLLRADRHGCAADAAVVAAMLEAGNVLVRPPGYGEEADRAHRALSHADGDHVTRFLLFHAYLKSTTADGVASGGSAGFCRRHFVRLQALQQAVQVYHQLRRLMTELNVPVHSTYVAASHAVDTVALRRAVLEGFFTQVAYRGPGARDDTFRTVRDGMPLRLHRQSALSPTGLNQFSRRLPTWLLYDRLEVQGADGTFARVGSPIQVEWLLETSDYYTELTEIPDVEIAYALKQASVAHRRAP